MMATVISINGADDAGSGGDEPPKDPPGKDGKPKKEMDWGHLDHLTNNFALIYGTDTVFDDNTGRIMKISAMAHAHGSDYVRMWKARPARREREKGKRWTILPEDVVFDPTEACDPLTTANLFRGLIMEPIEGDVKPMLELVEHLLARSAEHRDERDEVMHWLMCWLAYPLQHVGAKLRCAVVMHGDEGAGKNFLFETHLEVYGKYGKAVGQDELEDKFNDWRSATLFVLADEASSRQELVHNKNRLKALVTSPTVQINPKNLPRREESNHMNIAFLSNELTPLALDNTDRRYLVVYTPPAREAQFYKDLGKWRRRGGARAWMHYLMHYPLTDFDPFAPPPMTSAKRDLIDLNRKTPERFWLEWSGGELSLPYRSCSVDQAYRAYSRYALRVGDRYPVQKELFSRMVNRISDTLKKPTTAKTMKVDQDDGERSTRMLLVLPYLATNGVSDREWATAAVKSFEPELNRYIHGSRSHGSDDEGEHK